MSLIQEVSLSKDDINVIINVLEEAVNLNFWEDLNMSNQSDYFDDPSRYFTPDCAPKKRAKKLAQLLKWAGDYTKGHKVCTMKFSSYEAEIFKSGHPVQEGVGVDE